MAPVAYISPTAAMAHVVCCLGYLAGMGYRDDQEALQGRVDALASELDAANRKIAQLLGAAPPPANGNGETLGPLSGLGAPTSLRIERVVDGVLTTQGYEAIAAVIRARLGLETTQVGTRMETLSRPRAPAGRVQISVKDGKTHLLLERDWSDRTLGTWLLTAMAALFGGVVVGAMVHDMLRLSDAMSFAQVLWGAPLFGAIAAVIVRPHARKKIEAELAARRGAFAAIVEVALEHCAPEGRTRVQVVERDAEDVASEGNNPAEAEVDAQARSR